MKKFQLLIVIITISFFLTITLSLTCEMESGKSCCKQELSYEACFKKSKGFKKTNQDPKCNGKCGHSNGVTSTVQFNLASLDFNFRNDNFDFFKKELNYIHSQVNLCSGFSSLWLIPKKS